MVTTLAFPSFVLGKKLSGEDGLEALPCLFAGHLALHFCRSFSFRSLPLSNIHQLMDQTVHMDNNSEYMPGADGQAETHVAKLEQLRKLLFFFCWNIIYKFSVEIS